jgi:[protein-PII] uridylyltransferase
MSPPPEKPPGGKDKRLAGDASLFHGDAPVSREEFLSLTRDYLSILKKSVVGHRTEGARGKSFVQDYTRVVDAVVGVLFQRAAEEHGVPTERSGIAIIGMGGYGRAELAPYSDVDILVLCKRRSPLVKLIASSFIRLMWDIGFELGHAVESLIESESTLSRHMDSRTALFESRWVCGSRRIAKEIERQVKRLRKKDREAFLQRKIRDAVARHQKYSNSYQLIEPNVKLSPGGLRDFQTLVWLGMVGGGQVGLPELRRKGLLLPGEVDALERAYDFLLRVRVELHLATESKQDQLTVRIQKTIAERMGYRDEGGHLAVELLMRDYYNYTRTIYRITEDIIGEVDRGKNVGALLGRRRVARAGERLSIPIRRERMRRDPLYVFRKQKQSGLKLDRSVKRRLATILASDLADPKIRQRMQHDFPALFVQADNVSLVLRSMHETGFLGAIIPEYNELTSLKRYDLYHHYTVDEHSFQVVQNIEGLARASARRGDPLARLFSEVADKQVLFLAALLHDVGKIKGRGHAEKGAVLARTILGRFAVKQEQIDTVSHLIANHLIMSHYSQRRDPSDLGTLEAFCAAVKTRSNLKYLCLLTYADLRATSPDVWTEWKRTLLWELYLKAYQFMETTEKKPEAAYKRRKQQLLNAFRGPARERALAHLDLLPGRYLLTMSAAEVREHMRLVDELESKRVVVSAKSGRLGTEVTFCTHDKPYRLSQLCGVLTLNDCNILFAYAFTRKDGRVLDIFRVEDVSGTMTIDAARIEKIRVDLDNVVRGKLDIQAAVDGHIAKWKRRKDAAIPVPLKVEFENDVSGDVTIIDIFALDEPGLLFKITRALSEEGLTIHRARISTEANRAIDSFDIQDRKGKKITDITRLRSVRQRLEKTLA